MAVRVLVVNAGSTSVKLRLLGHDDQVEASADTGAPDDSLADEVASFLDSKPTPDVVGHRVVHGGERFDSSVLVDARTREDLGQVARLAPLHDPPALAAIDAVGKVAPGLKTVACFDTSFHKDMPEVARTYALPEEWRRWGVRRFGFHGLSCAWAMRRASGLLGRPAEELRLVVCHLGGGASVTAIAAGRSVDTTMGFTPAEGLVMATRSGDVDPGALTWVQDEHGLGARDVQEALEHGSGLLGLGGSSDMKVLLERRGARDRRAALAVEVYLHRLRAKIAAMTASLGGTDALVFTGGVGERAAQIRAEACRPLGWLGVAIDEGANDVLRGEPRGSPATGGGSGGAGGAGAGAGDADADISSPVAQVRTLVVHSREDLEIAAECRRLLG